MSEKRKNIVKLKDLLPTSIFTDNPSKDQMVARVEPVPNIKGRLTRVRLQIFNPEGLVPVRKLAQMTGSKEEYILDQAAESGVSVVKIKRPFLTVSQVNAIFELKIPEISSEKKRTWNPFKLFRSKKSESESFYLGPHLIFLITRIPYDKVVQRVVAKEQKLGQDIKWKKMQMVKGSFANDLVSFLHKGHKGSLSVYAQRNGLGEIEKMQMVALKKATMKPFKSCKHPTLQDVAQMFPDMYVYGKELEAWRILEAYLLDQGFNIRFKREVRYLNTSETDKNPFEIVRLKSSAYFTSPTKCMSPKTVMVNDAELNCALMIEKQVVYTKVLSAYLANFLISYVKQPSEGGLLSWLKLSTGSLGKRVLNKIIKVPNSLATAFRPVSLRQVQNFETATRKAINRQSRKKC